MCGEVYDFTYITSSFPLFIESCINLKLFILTFFYFKIAYEKFDYVVILCGPCHDQCETVFHVGVRIRPKTEEKKSIIAYAVEIFCFMESIM